jgi:hypothetical protein
MAYFEGTKAKRVFHGTMASYLLEPFWRSAQMSFHNTTTLILSGVSSTTLPMFWSSVISRKTIDRHRAARTAL